MTITHFPANLSVFCLFRVSYLSENSVKYCPTVSLFTDLFISLVTLTSYQKVLCVLEMFTAYLRMTACLSELNIICGVFCE